MKNGIRGKGNYIYYFFTFPLSSTDEFKQEEEEGMAKHRNQVGNTLVR